MRDALDALAPRLPEALHALGSSQDTGAWKWSEAQLDDLADGLFLDFSPRPFLDVSRRRSSTTSPTGSS